MNSVQIHLALTHVPVVLSLVGLVMLIAAFFKKSISLTKTAYVIMVITAVAAIPVFFTGEGAEEAVENIPTVSEAIIKKHEEMADLAMISTAIAGVLALVALLTLNWQKATRPFKIIVLLMSLTSGGLMVQTAHLGGQVRHSEIRNGVGAQSDTGQDNPEDRRAGRHQENDND